MTSFQYTGTLSVRIGCGSTEGPAEGKGAAAFYGYILPGLGGFSATIR